MPGGHRSDAARSYSPYAAGTAPWPRRRWCRRHHPSSTRGAVSEVLLTIHSRFTTPSRYDNAPAAIRQTLGTGPQEGLGDRTVSPYGCHSRGSDDGIRWRRRPHPMNASPAESASGSRATNPREDLQASVRLLRAASSDERGDARLYLAAMDRLAGLRSRYNEAQLNNPDYLPWRSPTADDASRARQGLIDDLDWLDDVDPRNAQRPTTQLTAILDSVADHVLVLLSWAAGNRRAS